MKELSELFANVTPGEWLYVKNDESISICTRNGETDEATVFIEVSGNTELEVEANAKLIMLAQSALTTVMGANEKLSRALTAALTVLGEAEVTIPAEAKSAWDELSDALGELNVTANTLRETAEHATHA